MRKMIIWILCCIQLGISTENKSKITSNDLASEGEFPYQVSMQLDGKHRCGGSLISKRHVLTAAHCVYSLIRHRVDKKRVKILIGTIKLNSGKKIDVDRMSHHPSYQNSKFRRTLIADIAVIRLNKFVNESNTVRSIHLPSAMQEFPNNTILTVSGFGNNVISGPASPVLKKLNMRIVDRRRCQQMLPSLFINSGHMCAVNAPGYGVCQGDSGSPLTLSNKQIVVGVASAVSGRGCGKGVPDIFTKVSHHMDFINSELALTN